MRAGFVTLFFIYFLLFARDIEGRMDKKGGGARCRLVPGNRGRPFHFAGCLTSEGGSGQHREYSCLLEFDLSKQQAPKTVRPANWWPCHDVDVASTLTLRGENGAWMGSTFEALKDLPSAEDIGFAIQGLRVGHKAQDCAVQTKEVPGGNLELMMSWKGRGGGGGGGGGGELCRITMVLEKQDSAKEAFLELSTTVLRQASEACKRIVELETEVQGARQEAEFAIAKFQDQAEQHQEGRKNALFRVKVLRTRKKRKLDDELKGLKKAKEAEEAESKARQKAREGVC